MLTGPSGLLPIQQWYFETEKVNVSHFNQSVLLRIDKSITEPVLQAAMKQLVLHHDALRFKYSKSSEHWEQTYGNAETKLVTEDVSTHTKKTCYSNHVLC